MKSIPAARFTDTILAYPDRDAVDDKLFLIIDPESAGYVVLKPSIELLESVHPRLPASLFHSLIGSINRWMRTYDYRDTEEHVELLREWAVSDDNPDDHEFSDVEGCTIYQFDQIHGAGFFGPVIQGTDGNFYGTTSAGGTSDEYHLLLNPVVLGNGLTISSGLADTVRLTLVTNRAFSCGTVLLCYEPLRD
jgi:hypothetical protein